MAAADDHLLLCVEDDLYRTYLEQEFADAGSPCTSVSAEDLAQVIVENPLGILVLQSESAEQRAIELSGRLKRLFGEAISIPVLLSPDYVRRARKPKRLGRWLPPVPGLVRGAPHRSGGPAGNESAYPADR